MAGELATVQFTASRLWPDEPRLIALKADGRRPLFDYYCSRRGNEVDLAVGPRLFFFLLLYLDPRPCDRGTSTFYFSSLSSIVNSPNTLFLFINLWLLQVLVSFLASVWHTHTHKASQSLLFHSFFVDYKIHLFLLSPPIFSGWFKATIPL